MAQQIQLMKPEVFVLGCRRGVLSGKDCGDGRDARDGGSDGSGGTYRFTNQLNTTEPLLARFR